MTLFEFMKTYEDFELTVWDNDYDIEIYFYNCDETDIDEWDKAMIEISKLLNIIEIHQNGVIVNLSEIIDKNIEKLEGLFGDCNIDVIMDDIEAIFSGNVSEKWIKAFANALK